ncbi:MAG: hypothetical protein HY290_32310 [Planctomycetia bacterium]|nr:hypothetical protein [Planctomycetia bacterium]
MSRRFDGYRGTLTALSIILSLWGIGFCMSPNRWDPVPRPLFNSDNRLLGWGSRAERVCRTAPEIHNYLWPLPVFT